MAARTRLATAAAAVWLAVLCLLAVLAFRTQLVGAFSGADRTAAKPDTRPIERDLDALRARKTLTVLAPYNSTSYFIYRGQLMGFELELLQAFAADQRLSLRVVVVRD